MGDDVRSEVWVSGVEESELSGSKGTANFVMKWDKQSKHQAYAVVEQVKGLTRPIGAEDNNTWVPVVAFECRGLDMERHHPRDGWVVVSTSGKSFTDVDLSDDWCEVDEDTGDCISIMNLQSKFELKR